MFIQWRNLARSEGAATMAAASSWRIPYPMIRGRASRFLRKRCLGLVGETMRRIGKIPAFDYFYRNETRRQPLAVDSIVVLNARMANFDSVNQSILFPILDARGEGLSEEANTAVWTIIDHAGVDAIRRYLPSVHEQVRRKRLPSSLYAVMFDRLRMYDKLPQCYGTQTMSLRSAGAAVTYIWPVEKPALVDSLRNAVGLPPLSDYVNLMKQTLGHEVIWDSEMTVERFGKLCDDAARGRTLE